MALLGGWFTLLAPAARVFELMSLIGFAGFWVWMVMGIAILRVPARESA